MYNKDLKHVSEIIYKNDLEVIATAKFNNLQSKMIQSYQFEDKIITLNDIKAVIELLLFSSHDCIYDMNEIEINYFFDSHGNFLQKGTQHSLASGINEFNPSANLYQYCKYVRQYDLDDSFNDLSYIDKYNLGKLNPFDIVILQNKAFCLMMLALYDEEAIEPLEFLKKQKNDYPRLLQISRELYPDETKKILNVYLDYLFDQDYQNNIELEDKNGELILKLNILTHINATAICNPYDRNEAIHNFFYGGLIMRALGTFHKRTNKTPTYEEYLSENEYSCFSEGRYISTSMRWNDTRTKRFETKKGYERRETVEEYLGRHEALAHDWNNKKFGEFSIKIKSHSVIFRWKYQKKFFILDSFDDIRSSDTIFDMLCLREGSRYPNLPHDLLINKSV